MLSKVGGQQSHHSLTEEIQFLPPFSASLAFHLGPNLRQNCLPALCFLMKWFLPPSQNSHTRCLCCSLKKKKSYIKKIALCGEALFFWTYNIVHFQYISLQYVAFPLDRSYKMPGGQNCNVWEFRHPSGFHETFQIPKSEHKNNFTASDQSYV